MAAPDSVRIWPDADPDEAAAIAAALEAVLHAEAAPGDGRPADPGWAGRRFAFAGRLARTGGEPTRVPDGAPADPWTAAGRLERCRSGRRR